MWPQHYDPLGQPVLSTLVAALPIVALLGLIAFARVRIHVAALAGLAVALGVALLVYRMPAAQALASAGYGAAYGLFPIGWIVLNVLFFHALTVRSGLFDVLRQSLAGIAPDPRLQLLLIAFAFGAFIEGVAGFGTPVAITGAILIQLGFRPLQASGLALIANTAPVAFGSLGIPITTLAQVTGLDVLELSRMAGRQLPPFSLLVPFWVVAAYSGWRGLLGVWPAALTAGVAFAVPQFLVSNFHGPWLVDTISGAACIGALALLLRVWRPSDGWVPELTAPATTAAHPARAQVIRAWTPWAILCGCIVLWGLPTVKAALDRAVRADLPMPGLHERVQRAPPVAPPDAAPEKAVYALNVLSATGTGILVASLLVAAWLRAGWRETARLYGRTVWRIRHSLATIAAMLALGNVTKFSGTDATLGLALAATGVAYPFFGTLLGWLGVALTGSDTASNVLFGSLQRITAERLGLDPVLMAAANSTGGVMGKMIDAQSIVVASTATGYYGHEGAILRFVFWHSVALAVLMGIWVTLMAYVPPFTALANH